MFNLQVFSYRYLNLAQQSTLRILAIIQALLLVHLLTHSAPVAYDDRPAFQLQVYVDLGQLHLLPGHLAHVLLVTRPDLQEMHRVTFMRLSEHEVLQELQLALLALELLEVVLEYIRLFFELLSQQRERVVKQLVDALLDFSGVGFQFAHGVDHLSHLVLDEGLLLLHFLVVALEVAQGLVVGSGELYDRVLGPGLVQVLLVNDASGAQGRAAGEAVELEGTEAVELALAVVFEEVVGEGLEFEEVVAGVGGVVCVLGIHHFGTLILQIVPIDIALSAKERFLIPAEDNSRLFALFTHLRLILSHGKRHGHLILHLHHYLIHGS